MNRVDLRLVELGLAPSRAKAQQMIRAGEVEVFARDHWRGATRVSEVVDRARVTGDGETLRFVSRGGLKLAAALKRVGLDVTGARVLDVGQSTGGFTDCVLQNGAAAVLGVDVGHDQLHPRLRADPRVTALEGVNARSLDQSLATKAWIAAELSLVVADLSFISITTVAPALGLVTPTGVPALLLIKPQFEAGREHLDGRGVVVDRHAWAEVRARVERALDENGFEVVDYFACALPGQDGNQEFFAFVRRR